jgi:hypothetical protein
MTASNLNLSTQSADSPLWRPSAERIEHAHLTHYMRWLRAEHGLDFPDYESLWQWSVTEIEAFWASIWTYGGLRAITPYRTVLAERRMPGARWFEGATLNYADQMLWHAGKPGWADRPAIIFRSERTARREISWGQLAAQAGALAATLARLGVQQGDRVVSYMPAGSSSAISHRDTSSSFSDAAAARWLGGSAAARHATLSSRLPILTMSPSTSGRRPSIREPLTNVPLRLRRSSTTSESAST